MVRGTQQDKKWCLQYTTETDKQGNILRERWHSKLEELNYAKENFPSRDAKGARICQSTPASFFDACFTLQQSFIKFRPLAFSVTWLITRQMNVSP